MIHLSFIIDKMMNKLLYCNINEKIKNSFKHFFIKITLNFKMQEKL